MITKDRDNSKFEWVCFVIHFCIMSFHQFFRKFSLIEKVRNDPIVSFLLEKSSLTPAQLDTLMANHVEGDLGKKTSSRERNTVSKGAFVRSLKQAEENVQASIYSLLLIVYLGLIPQEKFDQLLKTQRILSRVKELEPDRENILRLINGLEEFVQDFSGKTERKVIL